MDVNSIIKKKINVRGLEDSEKIKVSRAFVGWLKNIRGMKMFIGLFKFKNKKEEKRVMDYLNSVAKNIYDTERERIFSELENDIQKTIFLDWWYGGSLWDYDDKTKDNVRAKRYRHVSEHDWENVRGYIMEAVSNGMG